MADTKDNEIKQSTINTEAAAVESIPYDIPSLIYVVRGQQVMLDSDLAMLYQVETRTLN